MTNGNEAAFATPDIYSNDMWKVDGQIGLTKREYIATAIAQGLVANPDYTKSDAWYNDVKIDAVTQADLLIKQLNGE